MEHNQNTTSGEFEQFSHRVAGQGRGTLIKLIYNVSISILLFGQITYASAGVFDGIKNAFAGQKSAPDTQTIEVGFSPEGGAQAVVIRAIEVAKSSIRVLAYSFTSKPIAEALVAAHKRGVKILVVLDKSQKTEKYTSASFLANSGIQVRIDSQHAIAHNKVLIVDEQHVETGSFNFTSSADKRNAENAILIWNNIQLAKIYLKNWQEHWDHSDSFRSTY